MQQAPMTESKRMAKKTCSGCGGNRFQPDGACAKCGLIPRAPVGPKIVMHGGKPAKPGQASRDKASKGD